MSWGTHAFRVLHARVVRTGLSRMFIEPAFKPFLRATRETGVLRFPSLQMNLPKAAKHWAATRPSCYGFGLGDGVCVVRGRSETLGVGVVR